MVPTGKEVSLSYEDVFVLTWMMQQNCILHIGNLGQRVFGYHDRISYI